MAKKKTKNGLVDQATRSLRDWIVKTGHRPGDSLPGEIELAKKIGVSRTIIREALSRFRLLGIIETRRRRGMILKSPEFFAGMEIAFDTRWLGDSTLQDLFDMRLMLEMGLADIIFDQKEEKDLRKLETIVSKELKSPTEEGRIQADIEFHSALYQMTENKALAKFQDILHPLFHFYATQKVKTIDTPLVDHARLLRELRSGTTESFRLAMRHHLQPHFQIRKNR